MNSIIGLFSKYIISAALLLAYIETGPGGEKIGTVVHGMKTAIVSVDWSKTAADALGFIERAIKQTEVQPIEAKS